MRCVIVGGAKIRDYERARSYLRGDDYVIYCDSGLSHMEGLGAKPSLIVGDFDSYDDPHLDVETITLPVAKDDTDTVYAMREGMKSSAPDWITPWSTHTYSRALRTGAVTASSSMITLR